MQFGAVAREALFRARIRIVVRGFGIHGDGDTRPERSRLVDWGRGNVVFGTGVSTDELGVEVGLRFVRGGVARPRAHVAMVSLIN